MPCMQAKTWCASIQAAFRETAPLSSMITAVLAARSLLLNSLTVNQQLIKLCGIAHDIPTYRAYRMCFDLECSVAVQDRT